MEQITNFINSVGFPILAYLLLVKNNSKLIESINELNVTLKGIDTRISILEENERGKVA